MKNLILLSLLVLCGCTIGPHVRSPKPDVPFRYELGWWANQDEIVVQNVDIKVLDSRLNVLNDKTLAEILITGEFKPQRKGWRPIIRSVHLSEKAIKKENEEAEGEITLTPISGIKKDPSYNGDILPFSVKQEIILPSMNWGKNTFHIVCGGITKVLVVYQKK
jgi:hypothetical protein